MAATIRCELIGSAVRKALCAIPVYPIEATLKEINRIAGVSIISTALPYSAPICEDCGKFCFATLADKTNYLAMIKA